MMLYYILAVIVSQQSNLILSQHTTYCGENCVHGSSIEWSVSSQIDDLYRQLESMKVWDCSNIYQSGKRLSGIYTIQPVLSRTPVKVFCDMEEDGGGWTVLQRRMDGSENFNRNWLDYKHGFGNLEREHWLGNTYMSAITRQRLYKLRIRLWDFSNNTRYADYIGFEVGPEWDDFILRLKDYSGNAGDSLNFHNGRPFSTYDRDNDLNTGNCAMDYSAGFWFAACYRAGLNNVYSHSSAVQSWRGIIWNAWHGENYSLKKVEMKIRPVD